MSINIGISRRFEKLSSTAITVAGSNLALVLCFFLVVVWVAYGIFTRFSPRWESFIGMISSVKIIQKYYTKLSEFAKHQDTLTESHSIDEAHREHAIRQ